MSNLNHYQTSAYKRKLRVRAKTRGTAARPRLSVFRSNQHIYLQVVNDEAGKTLFTYSDVKLTAKKDGTKTQRAQATAKQLVDRLKKEKITALVIDRGAHQYHGRLKAAVEVIREAGVEV